MKNNLKFYLMSALCCMALVNTQIYSMENQNVMDNNWFIPNNNNQVQQQDNPNNLPIYKNEQSNQQKNLYDGKKKDIKRLADSCKDNIQFKRGLQNIGSTCYMNSVLQCLHKTPELTKYLMENSETIMNKMLNTSTAHKYWNNMNHNEITITDMSKNAQLMMEYLNLTANLSKEDSKCYAPNTWKQKLGEANPLFADFAAGDSKDLIIFLLEAFHTALNEPLKKKNDKEITNQYDRILTKNNFYNYFLQNENSRISELFYGVQEYSMTCQNCQKTTYNFDVFSSLIFPMRAVNEYNKSIGLSNNGNKPEDIPIIPLDSCFGYNEKTEFFNGENKIYCGQCKCICAGRSESCITIFPDNLILICNRDRGNTFKCKIPAPETLDLSKYETERSSDEKTLYDLCGIITHIGASSENGHFIAYCKLDDGWYQYNDAWVKKIDDMTKVLADDVLAGPGLENKNYIYFYKRKSSSKMQQVKQMYLKQNSELQSQQNNQ